MCGYRVKFQFIKEFVSIRLVHNLVHNRSSLKLLETASAEATECWKCLKLHNIEQG